MLEVAGIYVKTILHLDFPKILNQFVRKRSNSKKKLLINLTHDSFAEEHTDSKLL